MALTDVVSRRLEIMIERLLGGRQIDVSTNPRLGNPPIGFDAVFLRGQFLGHLNGSEIGFGDILAKAIVPSEVTPAVKFNDLVASIVKKSRLKTSAEYEQKMAERVRLGLRDLVAELRGPLVQGEVLSTEKIEDQLFMTDPMLVRLRARLTLEFEKYLFSPIAKSDLQGTLVRIQQRLTNRMVL